MDGIKALMERLPNKAYLKPEEVAKYYNVSKSAIYKWIAEGKIDALKICGKPVRIPYDAVEKMRKAVIE